MKRTTSAIAGLIVCGALLVACGGSAPSEQAPPANAAASAQGGQFGLLANRKPAPELPTENPTAIGIFVSRNGDTLTIREAFGGRPPQGTPPPRNGTPPAFDVNSGTPTDVVVNGNTKIYRDTTQFDLAAMQNGQAIQQTVEPVNSLDALNMDTNGRPGLLQVWGDASSGKLLASVIVYSQLTQRPTTP